MVVIRLFDWGGKMGNIVRIVLFVILRAEWAFACKAIMGLAILRRSGVWVPPVVVNVVGAVLGTRWAFRGMRALGWVPRMPEKRGVL